MEIKKFKKLEEVVLDQDFNKSYKNINHVMFCLSIFGHFASIFLAYFLISKILTGAIGDNTMLVSIASLILLVGLELLKREIFDKFSFQYLRVKSITHKDVIPLLIFSIIIISISFYSSISGAKEFSTKSKQIELVANDTKKLFEDSLTKSYNLKIEDIENNIKSARDKIDQKDKEQTQIESNQPLTSQEKNRVRDLKQEKLDLKSDIQNYQNDESNVKNELSSKIKEFESKTNINADQQKNENKNNSIFFVIISGLIETIILIGVYFNKYYKFRSYTDFKSRIDKDPNYKKWMLYNSILELVTNNDTKQNDKLTSNKNIQEICKINGINVLPRDILEFSKILNSVNIIKTSGSQRYFLKSKEESQEILRKHFNIK